MPFTLSAEEISSCSIMALTSCYGFLDDYVLLKCEGYHKSNVSCSQTFSQLTVVQTRLYPHTVWFLILCGQYVQQRGQLDFTQKSIWSAITQGKDQGSLGPYQGSAICRQCCTDRSLRGSTPKTHQQLCTCLNWVWSLQAFVSVVSFEGVELKQCTDKATTVVALPTP